MSLKSNCKLFAKNIIGSRLSKKAITDDALMLKSFKQAALTKDETAEIDSLWGKVIPNPKCGYPYFRIYKNYGKFDARYVPGPYYYPWIIRSLNTEEYYHTLVHKSLFRHILADLPQPETLVSAANGAVLDRNNRIISTETAVKSIFEYNGRVIVKGSTHAGGGKSVVFLEKGVSSEEIAKTIGLFGQNYVVQEIIEGSEALEVFNPSSLNTIRIYTLVLNGKISPCGAILRVGAPGCILDNLQQGGAMIGIDLSAGTLFPCGYSIKGERVEGRNNVIFDGYKIPSFEKIVRHAVEGHARIAPCRFAAWDFALDKNNDPLFIEVNMYWPGVRVSQIASGPVFADRTEEVIDYVNWYKKNRPLIHYSL